MAGVAGGEGDNEKPPFRWLDVARCAVAAVVTVLILAVIIKAIQVVLRPDSLSVTVAGGTVSVKRLPAPPEKLELDLDLRAENPNGRARMYYVNISAYLFDKNTPEWTTKPVRDSMFYFLPKDIAVFDQQQAVTSSMKLTVTNKSMSGYFDTLYGNANATMRGVTLRLDGDLVTEVTFNKTVWTTYYCRSLIVGGDPGDEAFKILQDDVHCSKA